MIKNKKYYNNTTLIKLYNWQQEAIKSYQKFYDSDEKSGLIIAPTGCGKSFLIMYIIVIEYIRIIKKDVIIMTKRKEIFDNKFITDTNKLINDYNLDIQVFDLINDDSLNSNIFLSNTKSNNIFIINNDKFIASHRYNNYKSYTWNNVKLLILDECHWSGAELFYNFLNFMKHNIVDKIIGFSATPVRTAIDNKYRTLEIFKDFKNDFNIIYQRSFIDSINEGDRVMNKWQIIPIQTNGFNEDDSSEYRVKKLNNLGIEYFLRWLNKFIIKSIRKKGILWFSSKKGLIEFYNYILSNDNKITYDKLIDIDFIPTYSGVVDDLIDTSNNITIFKNKESKSILLAIMRATEGFDDPKIDFGFNLFISNEPTSLVDQQKEGRVARKFENKEFGYYGFIVDKYDPNIKKIIAKRLGNWILYINEFETISLNNKKACTRIINDDYKYDDIIIDEDNIKVYTDGININSSIIEIRKHMQKINKIRLIQGKELIDTKIKYKKYAEENDLNYDIDIIEYNYNWIKFLRPDYINFISDFYTIEKLKNLKINNDNEYDEYSIIDNKIPSRELINNGIYNESEEHFNLSYIFNIKNKKKL